MAVTATRTIQIGFSGDVALQQDFSAAANAASPGEIVVQDLSSGDNTITAPVSAGVVVKALTIIFPSGNTVACTLKGTGSDAGILIGLTDPISLALASNFASLVITASDTIAGVRFIWS